MKVIDNLDLTEFNSYKIQAICSKAFFPESEHDLERIYSEYRNKIKHVIGNGNNIILSKERYDEYFVIFNGNFDSITVQQNIMKCQAGATMTQASIIALHHSLSGIEIFYDIPSSVGGAIVMNAGTKDMEIMDAVLKVKYFDIANLKFSECNRNELEFGYRNSLFLHSPEKLVTQAWFQLSESAPKDIELKMEQNKTLRWQKQPRNFPNAGSVFKRPPHHFVGKIIDDLGMRGFCIGDAQISTKHSGFIINKGNCTGQEILKIISEVKKRCKEKFNLELEIEQRVI